MDSIILDQLVKPFSTIGKEWMLITAGNGTQRNEWNTMTASDGSFGVMWGKNAVTCVIRPTRYTWDFVERNELITFSFFDPPMKKALQICGSVSGRDIDKVIAAGLTPLLLENGAIGFSEARLTLVCKKIYAQDLKPENFIDAELIDNYPDKDYHRLYIAEILRSYQGAK